MLTDGQEIREKINCPKLHPSVTSINLKGRIRSAAFDATFSFSRFILSITYFSLMEFFENDPPFRQGLSQGPCVFCILNFYIDTGL